MGSLILFVEKFFSGYRDGLDRGRDMRSWPSVPFFVILSTVFALNADNNYIFFFPFYVLYNMLILPSFILIRRNLWL